jgi:hypothetical protein
VTQPRQCMLPRATLIFDLSPNGKPSLRGLLCVFFLPLMLPYEVRASFLSFSSSSSSSFVLVFRSRAADPNFSRIYESVPNECSLASGEPKHSIPAWNRKTRNEGTTRGTMKITP